MRKRPIAVRLACVRHIFAHHRLLTHKHMCYIYRYALCCAELSRSVLCIFLFPLTHTDTKSLVGIHISTHTRTHAHLLWLNVNKFIGLRAYGWVSVCLPEVSEYEKSVWVVFVVFLCCCWFFSLFLFNFVWYISLALVVCACVWECVWYTLFLLPLMC